jgi:hypothetical protein
VAKAGSGVDFQTHRPQFSAKFGRGYGLAWLTFPKTAAYFIAQQVSLHVGHYR